MIISKMLLQKKIFFLFKASVSALSNRLAPQTDGVDYTNFIAKIMENA